MDLAQVLRLAHAFAGVAFMAGLVGRWLIIGAAKRAESLVAVHVLLRAAGPFGILLTGGGISVTVLGLATALSFGRPLFGPLQGHVPDWLFVSNLLMLPIFVFLVAVYPRAGRRIQGALEDADARGTLTPELAIAWADPRLRFARTYEFVAVTIVLGLMIAKPF
jgi:hypothetical protein